jgi:transketolase
MTFINITDMTELKNKARLLRARIIETSHKASIPHLGSCLSCIDILTVLYFSVLRIDSAKPQDENRDRFILSKGHGAPALFQVLAMRGFYPENLLDEYGADGGIFAEHPPSPAYLPGIEAATGSLGHGLPIALGMALSARIRQQSYRVYAVLSDGECNEGSVWEAALLAAAQQVDQLCIIIDFNKWQATGRSCDIMALQPFAEKWRAFGWHTHEIDGHDIKQLSDTLHGFHHPKKPTAIIAHTIKGKGVSFMEDDNNWHYRTPSASEWAAAKQELLLEV